MNQPPDQSLESTTLYRRAFADYGSQALWNLRVFELPTPEDALVVAHPVDLAVNKVMAAAGRRAVRDLVDLLTVHQTILPLGAVVWAAVEKSSGFTPEGLIAEIRRNSHYPVADWKALETTAVLDPKAVTQ